MIKRTPQKDGWKDERMSRLEGLIDRQTNVQTDRQTYSQIQWCAAITLNHDVLTSFC